MIMMNLIVSLIGITVNRNMSNNIQEDYSELNKLVLYYESICCLCLLVFCCKRKYVINQEGEIFRWITYDKVNKKDESKE